MWSSDAAGAVPRRVALWALAALVGQVAAQPVPAASKLRLRVGEQGEFRAVPTGAGITYRWTLDGRPAAISRTWAFVPTAADVGRHTVGVTVDTPQGPQRRVWAVRVQPPRVPRLRGQTPEVAALEVEVGETVELRVQADPAGAGAPPRVEWSVDGAPVGQGAAVKLRPVAPGAMRARALVTDAAGSAVAREWRIVARAAAVASAAPVTAPPTTSSTLAQPPRAATSTVPTSTTSTLPTTAARPPEVAAVVSRGPTAAEVQALLERYAAAWRQRDVGALRRLGQVTSDRQATALQGYFAGVRDLDVQVVVLEIHTGGERAVVRFTRRDTFRDPAGRLVSNETPPLEKPVVRTAQGVRFAEPGP